MSETAAFAARTFKLHARGRLWSAVFVPAAIAAIGTIALIPRVSVDPSEALILIPLGCMALIGLARGLSIPHTIEWSNDETIVFCAYGGRTTLKPTDIEAVEPDKISGGELVVRAGKKKIVLISQFNDFHEFITRLKAANPSVILRGC